MIALSSFADRPRHPPAARLCRDRRGSTACVYLSAPCRPYAVSRIAWSAAPAIVRRAADDLPGEHQA